MPLNVGACGGCWQVAFQPETTQFAIITLAAALKKDDQVSLTIHNFGGVFTSGKEAGSGFFLSDNSYDPKASSSEPATPAPPWQRFPSAVRHPWEAAARPGAAVGAHGSRAVQEEMM